MTIDDDDRLSILIGPPSPPKRTFENLPTWASIERSFWITSSTATYSCRKGEFLYKLILKIRWLEFSFGVTQLLARFHFYILTLDSSWNSQFYLKETKISYPFPPFQCWRKRWIRVNLTNFVHLPHASHASQKTSSFQKTVIHVFAYVQHWNGGKG